MGSRHRSNRRHWSRIRQELAQNGFNVIIHSRNQAKLNTVKSSLCEDFPHSEFRTAAIDAGLEGPELETQLDELAENIKDLHLAVLINNLGAPPPGLDPPLQLYEAITPAILDGMINTNLRFAIQVTARVLPIFIAHKRPSLILNMGSMAEVGFPYLAIYSGAKAFLLSWSTALSRELKIKNYDVEVLYIALMGVPDTSRNRDKPRLGMPDAKTFARMCLDRVGCGEFVVAGDWVQDAVNAVLGWLPEWLFVKGMLMVRKEIIASGERASKRV